MCVRRNLLLMLCRPKLLIIRSEYPDHNPNDLLNVRSQDLTFLLWPKMFPVGLKHTEIDFG